ncbi:VOC family protein [Rhodococcoides navarretei]|uniref:VOC family protein n=1 Tax=Rhodococcus navarretei TaxID=3128981 RepID=A0ABU9CXZ0_9NOCA
MSISFDHTIIVAKNSSDSAAFFRELFALPEAPSWGPFVNVQLTDGALVQFAEPPFEMLTHSYLSTPGEPVP